MAKEKAALKTDVAAKYDIEGDFSRRHYFGSFGEIDFNTLTIDRANALFLGGFPYLKKKAKTVIPSTVIPKRKKRKE